MTYVDKDDRDLDLNELSDFYDDSAYDELYGQQSFGERLGSNSDDDDVVVDEEDMIIDQKPTQEATSRVEQGFGEAISSDTNPHINDQLEDDGLSHEAEADYNATSDGFVTKAREKLDDWTDKYDRE